MKKLNIPILLVTSFFLSFTLLGYAGDPNGKRLSKRIATDSLLNGKDQLKNSEVLVYTKNGKGYVHDNIAAAVASIRELGVANQFNVTVTDDPAVFTETGLKKYKLLIFTSTNNDVFDTDEQRLAFRRYIEAGGGFVGVHSVTGTERNWTWFKMMIGETFSWHAKFQKFSVKNIDPTHPSMKGVPAVWEREDECYFGKELYPGIKVLMAHDLQTLQTDQADLVLKNAGSFGNYYPAVWYQHFDGGNIWITTLGHSKDSYQDPVYKNHLLQGIKFIADQYKGLNYSKAQAISKDDLIKN
jgi:type 1 glutamine amidotransferase